MRWILSGSTSAKKPRVPKPAALTRTSIESSAAMIFSTWRTPASVERSAAKIVALMPCSRSSSSDSLTRTCFLRATRKQLKPSFARRLAKASPMPLDAPVTTAVRPIVVWVKYFFMTGNTSWRPLGGDPQSMQTLYI